MGRGRTRVKERREDEEHEDGERKRSGRTGKEGEMTDKGIKET